MKHKVSHQTAWPHKMPASTLCACLILNPGLGVVTNFTRISLWKVNFLLALVQLGLLLLGEGSRMCIACTETLRTIHPPPSTCSNVHRFHSQVSFSFSLSTLYSTVFCPLGCLRGPPSPTLGVDWKNRCHEYHGNIPPHSGHLTDLPSAKATSPLP